MNKHARAFETRTASGSELFSLITRLRTITFIMLSTFSRLWMISIKMCETPLSWHTECSLAVRVSKARVLKLPIILPGATSVGPKGYILMSTVSFADTERPKTCDTGNIYVSVEREKDNIIFRLPIFFLSVTIALIITLLKLMLSLL